MDPEQTFIRVQERFSQILTPRIRVFLEYTYLFVAVTLFCILVVMHANYVQQPGCSSELSGVELAEAQLIQIKITSAGLWSRNDSESTAADVPDIEALADKLEVSKVDQGDSVSLAARFWLNWFGYSAWRSKLALKFWRTDAEFFDHQTESSTSNENADKMLFKVDKEEPRSSFSVSAKETVKAAMLHFLKKWYRRVSFILEHAIQILRGVKKLWVS